MEELTTGAHDSSSTASALAFSASARFTAAVGATHARLSISAMHEDLHDLFESSDDYISAWHRYLNVSDMHSDGCLRAAFTTVSEGTRIFEKIYQIGEKHPELWNAEIRDKLVGILEHFEDIQESLALLIDDEARSNLQRILEEAGIGGRALERKDAKTG